MNDEIESGLKGIFEKYKLLWFAVFFGMIILIIISVLLSYFEIILPIPVVDPFMADKITLIALFVLVIVIFFVKRTYLVAPKIVEKGRSSKRIIDQGMFTFLEVNNEKHNLLAKSVLVANSMILFVWLLADMIILVAFVHFILVPFIKTFILYSLVGIYSLIVNFPSFKLYKKIIAYIE